jgi:uncharacterized protein YkwD
VKRYILSIALVALAAVFSAPLRQAHAAQMVTNGSFESGATGWSQSTANGYSAIETGMAHTGTHGAWLCGYNGCKDTLWQTVTVPTTATSLTLTFWVYQQTAETAATCGDEMAAALISLSGANISGSSTMCAGASTVGPWIPRTLMVGSTALAPYRGQQIYLMFQAVSNAANTTSFFVDDVSLDSAGSIAASPTATARPTSTSPPRPTATGTVQATATAPPPTATSTPRPTATSTPHPTATSGSGSATCVDASTQSACIQYMLNKLNADRAAVGVSALTLNATETNGTGSCVGSHGHSVHMASVGSISHDQFPADICVSYMTAGENVGEAGFGTETADLNWLDSSMMSEPHSVGCSGNHACNIISPSFHQVGIGIYRVNNVTWLTEDFTN